MPKNVADTDDNAGGGKDSITVDFLEDFNKQKKVIEDSIAGVEGSTRQIQALVEQAASAFNPDDHDRISKSLEQEVVRAKTHATKGKAMLDKLKAEAEALARSNPKSERLQPYKAQYMRLCKAYVEAMKQHQQVKEQMKKTQTETLVRRGMIIYNDHKDGKTESEIRERVERDPAGFLRDAIMEEASEEAQQAYTDAQSRQRDIEMLVRSINEVASMFQDLAVLVQHQSAMLDSIERNVESAQTYVKKGNENLRSAIKTQKKTRKCYCIMLCLAIVIVCLLIGGLGSFFGGAFNKL